MTADAPVSQIAVRGSDVRLRIGLGTPGAVLHAHLRAYPAPLWEGTMTVCPIAIVAGCAKCPAFKVCPLKGVLGDQGKEEPPKAKAAPGSNKRARKAG
jgi:hypothetical protein